MTAVQDAILSTEQKTLIRMRLVGNPPWRGWSVTAQCLTAMSRPHWSNTWLPLINKDMHPIPRSLKILDFLTFLAVLVAALLVFLYAPLETVMGAVQKIFYFHVSANWVGMLGFLTAAGCGIALLRTGNRRWDEIAPAAVEVGMVFSLIGILTGMIWARPTWNTWWTWDPRLTTIMIMELVYAAYFILRRTVDEAERRAKFAAAYSILGVISVPLTFFSIRFSRTIHPVVIGSTDPAALGTFDMNPRMGLTFAVSLVAFTLLFCDLLWRRMRLEQMVRQVEEVQQED
jgi:heme exporter protein C